MQSPAQITTPAPRAPGSLRAAWVKQLYLWHWISSATCLIGMMLFAATGLTLNHAGAISSKPVVTHRTATLSAPVRQRLAQGPADGHAPLPPMVRGWLAATLHVDAPAEPADWSSDEVYLAMPRPGGDAWVQFDRLTGQVEYEKITRGPIALLNDLHKGRNTGPAWGWFIDVFAIACLVFSGTGLLLLQTHARTRPVTWPLVALGLAAPLLLVLLFIHL